MAVEIGQKAPDFTLENRYGEPVSLSDFRGEKNVVLVFFPNAFSGVCTTQFAEINAHSGRYTESDAQVIGVSVDSRWSLGAFADSLGLTDTLLLSDFHPKGNAARAFGTYLEDFGHSGRATFIIDKHGVVRGIELTDNPGQLQDEASYFAALAACER